MMEPAEDWYRCDAADEDFFNSLLGNRFRLTVNRSTASLGAARLARIPIRRGPLHESRVPLYEPAPSIR